jgi:hypothetical protein
MRAIRAQLAALARASSRRHSAADIATTFGQSPTDDLPVWSFSIPQMRARQEPPMLRWVVRAVVAMGCALSPLCANREPGCTMTPDEQQQQRPQTATGARLASRIGPGGSRCDARLCLTRRLSSPVCRRSTQFAGRLGLATPSLIIRCQEGEARRLRDRRHGDRRRRNQPRAVERPTARRAVRLGPLRAGRLAHGRA